MVRVNKNYMFAETISVTVLLCRYERSSGRQTQLWKIRKQSCMHFGMLCVNELALFRRSLPLLQKNLLILGKNLLMLGRGLLICGTATPQTHFGKIFRMSASPFLTCTVCMGFKSLRERPNVGAEVVK